MYSSQKKFLVDTHQAHNFFLCFKKISFFEIFSQNLLDLQRDLDRKINFFLIQKWEYILCATCVQINFMTLGA